MVKEILGAFGDVICAKKIVIQVFLLEQKHKMPTCLLLERDILHLLLQYLTGQMIKTSKSRGVAIFIGWKPPSGSETSSPKASDQTNPSTLEPVYVYQGKELYNLSGSSIVEKSVVIQPSDEPHV
jgi:hypothetical protein